MILGEEVVPGTGTDPELLAFFDRFYQVLGENQEGYPNTSHVFIRPDSRLKMERLASASSLVVGQKKECGEILTGLEARK